MMSGASAATVGTSGAAACSFFVATAFLAAALRFLVSAAFLPAALSFRVWAAFLPADLNFRVRAAFVAAKLRLVGMGNALVTGVITCGSYSA